MFAQAIKATHTVQHGARHGIKALREGKNISPRQSDRVQHVAVIPPNGIARDRTPPEKRWHRFYNLWVPRAGDAWQISGSLRGGRGRGSRRDSRGRYGHYFKAPLDFIGSNLYTRAVVAHDSQDSKHRPSSRSARVAKRSPTSAGKFSRRRSRK